MPAYRYAFTTTAHTVSTPIWQLYALSGFTPRLMEVAFKLTSLASAYEIGLGRPATEGTGNSGWSLVRDDSNEPTAAFGGIYIAWSAAPTVPAAFFRRFYAPNVSYFGGQWIFPRGLVIAATKSVVMWNVAATQLTVYNLEVEV